MDTIYFNELSLDPSISTIPSCREDIKQLLIQFIKTSLSYYVSIGSEDFAISSNKEFGGLIGALINNTLFVYKLIDEIEKEGTISHEESTLFKGFTAESFEPEWEPEFILDKKQAYGLGEASLKESYAISLNTVRKSNKKDWADSTVQLEKVPASTKSYNISVNHMSSVRHVIMTYEVWGNCQYKHVKAKKDYLLPNSKQSKYILQAFNCSEWDDFYTKYRTGVIDRTQCIKIARIVAVINGWIDLGSKKDNQGTYRQTFKAKKFYMQVDTETGAFEVYNGLNNHLGEIKFNSNEVKNPKPNRSIQL